VRAVCPDRALAHMRAAVVTRHADVRRRFLALYDDRELEGLGRPLRRFIDRQRAT